MQFFRRHSGSLVLALGELAIGVLLLVNPTGFTSAIIMALGVLLAILGLVSVIRYFRMDAQAAAQEQGLARGLALLLMGLFCLFNVQWLLGVFPVLTMLYGVITLLAGLYKVQRAMDIRRLGLGTGVIAGISALVTLIFSAVILLNPFASTAGMWVFIGLILIVEAVMDVLGCLMGRKAV